VAIEFTAVVSCATRFRSSVECAYRVDDPVTNWILEVDVESSDDTSWHAGGRIAFLIHSRVQLLRASAAEVVGQRFGFSIEDVDGKWTGFAARPA
jgi:hypothetical protein